MRKPVVIGLTGGIASGKTTTADYFERYGAAVIESDALSREIVEPGKPAWRKIVRRFGRSVLSGGRSIDRKKLAHIIFHDEKKRRILEAITHPQIIEEIRRHLRRYTAEGVRLIVVDIPLLYEVGLTEPFDAVAVAWVPKKLQIRRLKEREGLSGAEIAARLKAQMPLSEKRRRADYVIDNSGTRKETGRQVRDIVEVLMGK